MRNEENKEFTFERIKNHPLFQTSPIKKDNKTIKYQFLDTSPPSLHIILKIGRKNEDVYNIHDIYIDDHSLKTYFHYNLNVIHIYVERFIKEKSNLTLPEYFKEEIYPRIKPSEYLLEFLNSNLNKTIPSEDLNKYLLQIKMTLTTTVYIFSLVTQQSISAKTYLETLGERFSNMLTSKFYIGSELTKEDIAMTLLDNLPTINNHQPTIFPSNALKQLVAQLENIIYHVQINNNNENNTTNDNTNDIDWDKICNQYQGIKDMDVIYDDLQTQLYNVRKNNSAQSQTIQKNLLNQMKYNYTHKALYFALLKLYLRYENTETADCIKLLESLNIAFKNQDAQQIYQQLDHLLGNCALNQKTQFALILKKMEQVGLREALLIALYQIKEDLSHTISNSKSFTNYSNQSTTLFNQIKSPITLFAEFMKSEDINTAKEKLLNGYHSLANDSKVFFNSMLSFSINQNDFSSYGFDKITFSDEKLIALQEISELISTQHTHNSYSN